MQTRGIAIACALVLVLGVSSASFRLGQQAGPSSLAGSAIDFPALNELLGRVQQDALNVPPVDALRDSARDGALRGLLAGLDDPYAAYYSPEEYRDLNEALDGEVSGVGIVVEQAADGGLVVVTPIDGGPAARAGVEAGERIISVEGQSVVNTPLESVVNLIKGEPNTSVTIGFAGGSAGPRELLLTRELIVIPNVESRQLDDGTGYVRLRTFSRGSATELKRVVTELTAQGARGIVLDLRNNPGGLLSEAVDVVSVFVESGAVVSVRGRGQAEQVLSTAGGAREDLPLVVLVNEGSASASEIVAGALQDLDRAPILGVTTFGKGTVQTVQPLTGGSGYKFTTAAYFTPSGDSIEGVGVVPDQMVEGVDEQLAAAQTTLAGLIATSGQ